MEDYVIKIDYEILDDLIQILYKVVNKSSFGWVDCFEISDKEEKAIEIILKDLRRLRDDKCKTSTK